MKVCAEAVPAGAKPPAVPTNGYHRQPPAADLPFIGPRRAYLPARRTVGRGKAAGW